MTCDGTVIADSEVIYWRDPPAVAPASLGAPEPDKFLTFEYDSGGWNNIRMGIECVLVLAHYLRRTLVLPPPQSLYLIAKTYGDRRDFGLADFLNTSLLASHPGWRTKTMPEFLKESIAGAPVAETPSGRQLWKLVEKSSDALLPPLGGRYVKFGGEAYVPELAPEGQKAVALDLADKRHVHSAGSGNHRILRNYYSFLFFEDGPVNRFYKRFIRDYARYQDPIQCAAHTVLLELRKKALLTTNATDFYAIHARRNDFQYRLAKISASDIVANLAELEIPRGALVYLATDDPAGKCKGCLWERKPCDSYPVPRPKKYGCPDDPSWTAFARDAGWNVVMLGDFTDGVLRDLNPNYYGMVDQVVCTRARVWAGTYWSTFSAYIHRMRGYHGLGEASYYHTPGKLRDLQMEKRSGPGWMREWRAGWTDDDAGGLIDR